MSEQSKGSVVLSALKPKAGKQAELMAMLEEQVQRLRQLGFVSGYPRQLMTAADGTVISIFQWDSDEAAKRAHEHPEFHQMWEAMSRISDAVPLSEVPEAQKPFSNFKQAKNDRTNRLVHFEIEADEPEKVRKFFENVFGWEFTQFGNVPYWLADTGNEPCPGIDGAVMKRKQPQTNVTNIIHVESIDESVKKVERAGGKICVPKMAIPGVGYVAYFLDPEDNVFGMMQPDMTAR